jgi:hypothetical protein
LKNIVLVICVSSLVAIFSTSSNSTRLRNMVFSVIGFGIWGLTYHVNSRLNLDQYELQSLVVTEVLVLAALYFITSSRESNKLQIFRNQ